MCGEIGVPLSEVNTWQYHEFIDYVEGYYNRVDKEWDIARTISFFSVAPYSKKIKKPRQLFRLRGERPVGLDRTKLAAEAFERVKASQERKKKNG